MKERTRTLSKDEETGLRNYLLRASCEKTFSSGSCLNKNNSVITGKALSLMFY